MAPKINVAGSEKLKRRSIMLVYLVGESKFFKIKIAGYFCSSTGFCRQPSPFWPSPFVVQLWSNYEIASHYDSGVI